MAASLYLNMTSSFQFKYKAIIAYEGTRYSGWQLQSNAMSVQSLIEEALSKILRTPRVSLHGSGRTDAGVHALAQVAHFTTDFSIDISKTLASLNSLLPKDIRILFIEKTDLQFHARFSALSKTYHYRLHLDPTPDPFKQHYAYNVPHGVDLSLLRELGAQLIGTHDFTSFANKASQGSAAKNAIRTLYRLDILEEEGGVRLEFEGNGFLYGMVRIIVGTLLDVCSGKIGKDQFLTLLKAKDRRQAGTTAPPHGLYLAEVKY